MGRTRYFLRSGQDGIDVSGTSTNFLLSLSNLTEIRCIEHTIHLGVAAFVKAVGPKMKSWTKNHTASVEDADDEDDNDEEWVVDWNQLDVIPSEELIDEEINFEPGDTLGKALALINQVSLELGN